MEPPPTATILNSEVEESCEFPSHTDDVMDATPPDTMVNDANIIYHDSEETNVGLIDTIDHNNLLMESDHEAINLVDPVRNIPHVGMKFSSEDEAYNYYNAFGRCRGFSIRKSTFALRDGVIARRNFVCSKKGFKDMKDKRRLGKQFKRRKVDRVGCLAKMSLKKIEDGVWEVIFLNDDHNHALICTPSKVALLRSHHKGHLQPTFKSFVDMCDVAGLGAADMARVLTITGSSSEPNILPQQCTDHLQKNRKNNVSTECQSIIQYFLKRRDEDCQFYFSMEVTEDNTCRSIFWADGRARRSYFHFSDVVVFDVTYKTNSFKLPFAPFTGVNHHWQSTLFGCALIADERVETFVWLFKTWLKCVWGKMPNAIITDQDLELEMPSNKYFQVLNIDIAYGTLDFMRMIIYDLCNMLILYLIKIIEIGLTLAKIRMKLKFNGML